MARRRGRRAAAAFARFLCLVWVALLRSRKFGGLPQMSDPLPAVPTRPFRDKLKDSVDRVTLFGRPLLDPGNQQLIDGGQLLARPYYPFVPEHWTLRNLTAGGPES